MDSRDPGPDAPSDRGSRVTTKTTTRRRMPEAAVRHAQDAYERDLERAAAERRRRLSTAHESGWTMRAIAATTGLSPGRVEQIINGHNG